MEAETWHRSKTATRTDRSMVKERGAGSRRQEEARSWVGPGPRKSELKRQRGRRRLTKAEKGERTTGERPLPPQPPQCRAGLCILKASPETPACWNMKARRKTAKLKGGQGPDAGEACSQEGGNGMRRHCSVSWPPPSHTLPRPTQGMAATPSWAKPGCMGSPCPRLDSGVCRGQRKGVAQLRPWRLGVEGSGMKRKAGI